MASKKIELSVVFPAYNEGNRIKKTLQATRAELQRAGLSYELIVVDDGSSDRTSEVTAALARTAAYRGVLQLVSYRPNQGKGWALKQGVRAARGKYIAFLDADLDISPDHLPDYLQRLKEAQADAVVGSKRHPDSNLEYSRMRVWISNLYYWVNRILFRLPVKDTQSGVKVFRREALLEVMPKMLVKQFAFDLEMLVNIRKNGGSIIEAPVRIADHFHFGRIRFSALWQAFLDTMGIFFRSRIARYYDWNYLPEVAYRRTPVTVLLAVERYSEQLEEAVVALQNGLYPDLKIIVVTCRGGFSFPGVKVVETGPSSPEEQYLAGIRLVKTGIVGFLREEHRLPPGHFDRVAGYFAHPEISGVCGPLHLAGATFFNSLSAGVVRAASLMAGCGYRYRPFRQRPVQRVLMPGFFARVELLRGLGSAECDDAETGVVSCDRVLFFRDRVLYSPDLRFSSVRQEGPVRSTKSLWRLARESGYLATHRPRIGFRFAHLLPSLILVGLAVGGVFSLLSPYFRLVYQWVLLAYAAALFLVSGFWLQWIRGAGVALLLAVSQVAYGVGFLRGLFTRSRHNP